MSNDHLPHMKRVAQALEQTGVPHVLVGSMSSNVHGFARSTKDIDLVVQTDREGLERLFAALRDTTLPAHDVHGRSTIVHLTWDEVERRFGRR